MSFPKDFVWGAAAASYQIEGGAYDDGKGLSVWDTFCKQLGKTWMGNTGDVACDHYHRYKEDAALMGEIGLKAYRLSINWARVLPEGVGKVNEKGLEFYDKLVDALLENNVDPWVTLFHWDYPYELYKKGGWLNRDSSDWFAEYTKVIVDKLSDRVTNWMTLNEPQCFIGLGHLSGEHAPGLKLGMADILQGAHHALMSHGKAVQVIRAHSKSKSVVGLAPVGVITTPATDKPEDVEVARKMTFGITSKTVWSNTWWVDPMILGKYPEDGVFYMGSDMPEIHDGDMEIIKQPLDFYGFNIYTAGTVRSTGGDGWAPVLDLHGPPMSTMEWELNPKCLYWGSRFLYERYKLPIVVTENGMANTDWIHRDGKVHDPQRIDYLAKYIGELGRAIDDGVDVQGYFLWSIMDNFEWAHGYKRRFGIIFVDFNTGERTLKDSAYWYKDLIASNGDALKDK